MKMRGSLERARSSVGSSRSFREEVWIFMMVEFSIVPLGEGASVSAVIARVLRIVMDSGVPYSANPMGTVIEGEWERVMPLVKQCHDEVMRDADRAVTTIKIDDYKGKGDRLGTKLASVEQKLGRKLDR
jgi:uncharacterized protein (TIGR00106 family)